MSDEPAVSLVKDDDPATTATCDVCGEVFTSKPGERASARFLLGTHRWAKHQLRGDGRKTPKADEPTPDDFGRAPVASVVRSIGSAAGAGARRAPSADDLAKGLGRGLGLLTMGAATVAVESDPLIPDTPDGERQRDALVDYLSLTDAAAVNLMRPLGRIAAGTKANDRYGRAVVDNVDAVASLVELGVLVQHWRKYLSARGSIAAAAGNPDPYGTGVGVSAPAGPAPAGGPPPFQRDLASPAPTQGRVLTPEDVERMRNR